MSTRTILLLAISCYLAVVSNGCSVACSSSLTSSGSTCNACPSSKDLTSIRQNSYRGIVAGMLLNHYSYTMRESSTQLSTQIAGAEISTCCSTCNSISDCHYWTWKEDSCESSTGTCYFYNIDQCSYSDSAGTKHEDLDTEASSYYSSAKCGGSSVSSPPPPKASPPPPPKESPPPPPKESPPPPPKESPPPPPKESPPPPPKESPPPPLKESHPPPPKESPPPPPSPHPPPYVAPPPPGVKGDPHFTGWDGVHFDFTGRPGHSYCLLTDKSVHVNMYLDGYVGKVNKTEEVHTWIKAMGIVTSSHELALYAREGSSAERGSGYMKKMLADGKEFTLGANEALLVGTGSEGSIKIAYQGHRKDADDEIDIYEVEIPGTIRFQLKMRPEIKVLRQPGNAWVHFSMEVLDEKLTSHPHGILGQTLWNLNNPDSAPDSYSVQYSGIVWAWEVAGRDGDKYIQGKPRDYLTSQLLATDCKYGQLAGSEKKLLGFFPLGCNRKALIC